MRKFVQQASRPRGDLSSYGDVELTPKVLIVDSDRERLDAIQSVVHELGAEAFLATSVNQALPLVEIAFAAVFIHVRLPGMDGFELAARIRDAGFPPAPILFLTDGMDTALVERAYNFGAVDCLQVPVPAYVIRAKLGAFLQLARRAARAEALYSELETRGEEQLRLHTRMLESMTEGVSLADEQGILVYVNPAEERIFGYGPGELLGQHVTVQNAYLPEENQRVVNEVIEELQREGFWSGEWHNRRKDGTTFVTHSRITAVELGGMKFWMCVQEDVTERTRAESALRLSEKRFRTAVQAVNGLLWTNSAKGQMEGEQPGWAAYTGQSFEAYQGFGWATAVHPDDAQLTVDAWNQAVVEQRMFVFEHRVRRYDGTYRLFSIRALPLADEGGDICEWVGVHTDITDERQLLNAVRESETRFRNLADNAPVMVWVTESDGTCTYLSRSWYEFTGQTEETGLGVGWLDAMHPDDRQRVESAFWDATRTESSFRVEYRLRARTGEFRSVIDAAAPRLGPSGEFLGYVGSVIDISERTAMEAALREQFALTQAIADNAAEAIFVLDSEGRTTFANPAAEQMFGWTIEELRGQALHSVIHYQRPDGTPLPVEECLLVQRVLVEGLTIQGHEDTFWRRDGRPVPVLCSNAPIRDSKGLNGCILVAHDISEIKRSQALLRLVIDNVPGLVSYLDRDARYQFANHQYHKWFGPESIVGRPVREVVGAEAFERAWPYLERAFAGEPVRFEELLPYDKAQPRYVQIAYMPDQDVDGTVRGVVAMVQDITSKKQMEQALRLSEEKLQQVFAQAPVAIVVLRGPEFVIELANPTYCSLVRGRDLVGRPFVKALPEVRPDVLAAFYQVMDTGEPYVREDFYIPYDQNGDGVAEDHWFNVVFHPLRDPAGAVTGVVVVCTEVSTQVMARKELERANRELEEFAYVASHDLQEPLRMVGIYTQLLVRHVPEADPSLQQYAEYVREGVKRMEELIRDLLRFSRTIQEGGALPSVGCADLSAALHEALVVMQPRIQDAGAVIVAEDLPEVRGDVAQLAHVFQNLISNALKYRKADVPPKISIAAQRQGQQWLISVQDNGIGFEQQYAERIFGLFRRLHKNEYPGTGLGLAICQRIVERCGGRIWAVSQPDAGSTFFFLLPEHD